MATDRLDGLLIWVEDVRVSRLVYLDQNAWVALARGSSDKLRYPAEHAALTKVVEMVRAGAIRVPLSFANVYETLKINVRERRLPMALAQSLISGGIVYRGRRRIFAETLRAYLAAKVGVEVPDPPKDWFLSDLWFEAGGEYSLENFGFEMPDHFLAFIREDPGKALFDYLANSDEAVRLEGVRRYSAGSADLISRLEARRALVAGQPLALRRRAYPVFEAVLDAEHRVAHRFEEGLEALGGVRRLRQLPDAVLDIGSERRQFGRPSRR